MVDQGSTAPTETDLSGRRRHARRRSGAASGGLLRSSALMAAGSVVSRGTGMFRLTLQAAALGTLAVGGAYNTANTLPTSLYTLLIGGALNSVLVPQLVRARTEHADGGQAHEQRLVTLVLSVLAVGTVVGVVLAPWIVGLYMPDTPDNHQVFELTVAFARFLLPQIFFYGLFFMLGQILNARGKFGAMMWTPVLNNIVLITMFGLYRWLVPAPGDAASVTPAEVRLLGIGTTIGIALQAVCLIPYLAGTGFRWRPRFDWRGTGLGKSVAAARWTLLFVLVNQVALTVVTRYANAVDAVLQKAGAGNSAYFFAQNIWMLPQGIITVSLVTAMLPRMSRAVAEHRLGDVREDLSRGLRVTGVAIVPAAFFFLAFGPQIATVMFSYSSSGAASAQPLGQMLQAFALGLVPFSAQYLLLRGFYAFEDTRTPFWMAVWISGLDIILATGCHLFLPPRWVVIGMAAAYAASYAGGLLVTGLKLRRRLEGRLDGERLVRTYGKLMAAAGAASAVGWAVARICSGAVPAPVVGSVLALAAGGVTMLVLFVLLARLLRVSELRSLPGLG
ncbi:murein biosynthesis integral membrane protein MurJ [Kitasatospora aureofaciens]|uniref:murein biosynthesis integral membrane protein MurJ n=1 Tax=Kitasatospora aureofaciens TaxID=1894 RepID=UPI000998327B|nr:murein biosynthesis integral membrane protein MurJ [Kitasatospora aureofaciens]